jgi:hypothetical protein
VAGKTHPVTDDIHPLDFGYRLEIFLFKTLKKLSFSLKKESQPTNMDDYHLEKIIDS